MTRSWPIWRPFDSPRTIGFPTRSGRIYPSHPAAPGSPLTHSPIWRSRSPSVLTSEVARAWAQILSAAWSITTARYTTIRVCLLRTGRRFRRKL
jgi:hypothetical protein